MLAAPQADALALLHTGRAQLALVFERPSLDGREGFQEVASDTMVAVMAPDHPVLAAAGGRLREEHLTNTRQIVVAGRDLATSDPRFVFARHVWRTDNALAALSLITAGLGWGWLPRNFAQPHVAAGALVEIAVREPVERAGPVGRRGVVARAAAGPGRPALRRADRAQEGLSRTAPASGRGAAAGLRHGRRRGHRRRHAATAVAATATTAAVATSVAATAARHRGLRRRRAHAAARWPAAGLEAWRTRARRPGATRVPVAGG